MNMTRPTHPANSRTCPRHATPTGLLTRSGHAVAARFFTRSTSTRLPFPVPCFTVIQITVSTESPIFGV